MQTLKFPPNVWREVLQVLITGRGREEKGREPASEISREQEGQKLLYAPFQLELHPIR